MATVLRKQRPSRMPLTFACPSSLVKTAHKWQSDSPAAKMGKAAHDALADLVDHGDCNLALTAQEFEVDPEELAALYAAGRHFWNDIRSYITPNRGTLETEYEIDHPQISGTPDLIWIDEERETGIIVDWKSGRVQTDAEKQLAAYATIVMDHFDMAEGFTLTSLVVWLRHGQMDVDHWDATRCVNFLHDLEKKIQRAGVDYNPGPHCGYCPNQIDCDARPKYLARVVESLEGARPKELTPQTLAAAYFRVQEIERIIRDYRSSLRDVLDKCGDLVVGDKILGLRKSSVDIIDPIKAVKPALKYMDKPAFNSCLSISKPKLVKATKDAARKGNKTRIAQEMVADLREAGAIRQEEKTSICVKGVENGD